MDGLLYNLGNVNLCYSGVTYTSCTDQYLSTSCDLVFDLGYALNSFWWCPGDDGAAHNFLAPSVRGSVPSNSPILMDNRLYDFIANLLPAFNYTSSSYMTDTGDNVDISDDPAQMHAWRHPATSANFMFLDFHVEAKQPYFKTGKHIYRDIWKGVNNHGTPYLNNF